MSGLIRSLEIARRSLVAQQGVLSVLGHNVANVGTPGYTRRVAELRPAPGVSEGALEFGSGVDLAAVTRQRDAFLDREIRRQAALRDQWSVWSEELRRLEALVGEPSESGLGALLDAFFDGWTELANLPESLELRRLVVAEGERLADTFHHLASGLQAIREDIDARLTRMVATLDDQLQQVADLNRAIGRAHLRGGEAPDLRDLRDRLVEEIAATTGAVAREDGEGRMHVVLDGHPLVAGDVAQDVTVERISTPSGISVRIQVAGRELRPAGGRLGAMVEVRDRVLEGFGEELDRLAGGLAAEVNRLHAMGAQGIPFFEGETAQELRVSEAIRLEPRRVETGTSGEPGENDLAAAIAALRDTPLPGLSGEKPGDVWAAWVGRVGSLSGRGREEEEAAARFVETLEAQRAAHSGVNLDEEMIRMVETERAFQAAARLFTTADAMLEELLGM